MTRGSEAKSYSQFSALLKCLHLLKGLQLLRVSPSDVIFGLSAFGLVFCCLPQELSHLGILVLDGLFFDMSFLYHMNVISAILMTRSPSSAFSSVYVEIPLGLVGHSRAFVPSNVCQNVWQSGPCAWMAHLSSSLTSWLINMSALNTSATLSLLSGKGQCLFFNALSGF